MPAVAKKLKKQSRNNQRLQRGKRRLQQVTVACMAKGMVDRLRENPGTLSKPAHDQLRKIYRWADECLPKGYGNQDMRTVERALESINLIDQEIFRLIPGKSPNRIMDRTVAVWVLLGYLCDEMAYREQQPEWRWLTSTVNTFTKWWLAEEGDRAEEAAGQISQYAYGVIFGK